MSFVVRKGIDYTLSRMFTHIVLWKLKETADGRSRDANARLMKERLEELANMMDGLRCLELNFDVTRSATSADVALYSEFESQAAYQAYADHPAHKAVAAFVRDVTEERRVVDYES